MIETMSERTGFPKRVLVTGGAGFIGSHLVDRLLSANVHVACLDNFDPFYDPSLKERYISEASQHPDFRLIRGDICDENALEKAFAWGPDAVVHLAALAGVRPSLERPADYFRTNLVGTSLLAERIVKANIGNFVFASSSSVYGNRRTVPFSEDDRVDDPVSPYAASKKAGELLCYTFHHVYQLNVTCLRFFTVYGPRQRPEMAIHKFVRSILDGTPLTLFGDGTSSRDYTYIDDIIDGVMAALSTPNGFRIINLGESKTITLAQLVELLEEELGLEANRHFVSAQPGDVDRTYADISRAQEQLGYHPQVSISEGVRRFVSWYREFFPTVSEGTPT